MKAGKSFLRRPGFYVVLVLVLGVLGAVELIRRSGSASAGTVSGGTAVVRRDDLVITVTEGGTLRARDSIDIASKVEGNATILYLVPEGKYVQKDEKLIELDGAELKDKKVQEDSQLSTSRADYLAAEEALAIQQNQAESEVKSAELTVQFGETDLKKFIEGDRKQQLQKAHADIKIADEELSRANDRLTWTTKLESQGIVTRQELDADKLAVQKAEITRDQANLALEVLEKYEFPKQEARLRSDLEEAQRQLERVKRRTASEIAQRTATRDARKVNYEIQQQKVKKLQDQIDNLIITAPQSGMVVYWIPNNRWSNQRPPEVGGEVRYRQTILSLPDTSQMEVDVQIHESQIDRVKVGQRAIVTLDAFPDKSFTGQVKKIAVMADSARWFNPDVKVYTTVVTIDQSTEGLKPGMSAQVEITADIIKQKLVVPVTGVHVLRGRTAAIVRKSSGEIEVREVAVGPTNDKFVVIESGLTEGEDVFLYVPANMPAIPWTEDVKHAPAMAPGELPPSTDVRPGGDGGTTPRGENGGGNSSGRSGRRRPRGEGGDTSGGESSGAGGSPAARIPGLTDEQRTALRERMQNAASDEERQKIIAEMRQQAGAAAPATDQPAAPASAAPPEPVAVPATAEAPSQ